MTQYKMELSKRRVWMIAVCLLAAVAVVAGTVYGLGFAGDGFDVGFKTGVQTGLFLGVLLILLRTIFQYSRALGDEKALEAMYIRENDERNRYIRDKIGGTGLDAAIIVQALSVIIAGFFDNTVFLTLLGTLISTVLIKATLKIYFARKF